MPSEPPLSWCSGAARTASVSPSARPSPTLDNNIDIQPDGRGSYLIFDFINHNLNQSSGREPRVLDPSVLTAVDGVALGSEARAERYEA